MYAGLRIFIQLPATLTKLCHIKRDHHNALKMSTVDRNARWVVTLKDVIRFLVISFVLFDCVGIVCLFACLSLLPSAE